MKTRRIRITNDSLNSYGSRVLTAGMDVDQYKRNPVLLYMHERGEVIGYVKDIKVEDGEVTGELMFDEVTELSRRCKKQYEFGSLKMVSVGIDILETSEDPSLLLPGQMRPTITRSKLFEVSLVDVGANDDAIVLRRDGRCITLGKGGECLLPALTINQKSKDMEQKVIALSLGLPETADEAAIMAAIEELKAAKAENLTLKKQQEDAAKVRIEAAVEKAVAENRVSAEHKASFLSLGKEIGEERLQEVLSSIAPQVKLSAVLQKHDAGIPAAGTAATYKKLSEVPADKVLELREKNVAEYKRLYKAEYGMECPELKD